MSLQMQPNTDTHWVVNDDGTMTPCEIVRRALWGRVVIRTEDGERTVPIARVLDQEGNRA